MVKVRTGNNEEMFYCADSEALTAFSNDHPDLRLGGASADTPDAVKAEPGKPQRRARLYDVHESRAISRVLVQLSEKGLNIDHFSAQDKPLFEIIEDNKQHPLFSVPEILSTVLEIGRRGLEIYRFKGLGEMNAKQLYETTMQPDRRKLLQVKFNEENMVEADKMFTVLMGDLVEPRRQFIEDNALNVRNLDI